MKSIMILVLTLLVTRGIAAQGVFDALNDNDPARANALIAENPEVVHVKDEYDVTPAHLAVMYGYTETLMLLLENGAEVDSRDSDGQSPLFWAVGLGSEQIVEILLEHGADPRITDDALRTPIFYAVSSGKETIVRRLLSLGVDLNSIDVNGGGVLLFALERFIDKRIVDLLLENDVVVHVNGEQGRRTLHLAASGGYEGLVNDLLENEADVFSRNNTGGTLLHSAAAGGLTELVSYLLGRGLDIDAVDGLSRTSVHVADDWGNHHIVEQLRRRGAVDRERRHSLLENLSGVSGVSDYVHNPENQSVEVTYVANTGFLLERNDKKVLIDALHSYFYYAPTPSAVLSKMNGAQPPFDNIDVLLISHPHGDHFDPALIGAFLRANPATRLIASSLTCQRMRDHDESLYDQLAEQVVALDVEFGGDSSLSFDGIEIRAMGLDHGGDYLNLAIAVDLDGVKLIHLGDMDPEASMRYLEDFRLHETDIDIAFASYAFAYDPGYQSVLDEFIRPQYTIAMHIQSELVDRVAEELESRFDNTIVFREAMQKEIFTRSN